MALLPYEIVRQNRLMAASPAMSSGVPEDPLARARALIAAAREGAPQGIDPRMAAILDRRLQRADEQERELQRAQKGTVWEALMRAGTAMASNQSPFFAPALAAGANAALSAVQQRRAEAIKERARLGDLRDDVEMLRIQQDEVQRERADKRLAQTLGVASQITQMDRAAAELAIARMKADPEVAELEKQKLILAIGKDKADILLTNARVKTEGAQADAYRAQAVKALREGSGGVSLIEARGDRAELDKAAARYRGAAARYEALRRANPGATMEDLRAADSKTVDDYLSTRAELEGYSGAFERRYGRSPYIGGSNRPAVPRPTAAMNNDPLGLRGQR